MKGIDSFIYSSSRVLPRLTLSVTPASSSLRSDSDSEGSSWSGPLKWDSRQPSVLVLAAAAAAFALPLPRQEAAPPASDPHSLLTLSGSSGCVARGLDPGRLVSEPSEVLRSRLLLMLLAQSEPEEEELRLVLAP